MKRTLKRYCCKIWVELFKNCYLQYCILIHVGSVNLSFREFPLAGRATPLLGLNGEVRSVGYGFRDISRIDFNTLS